MKGTVLAFFIIWALYQDIKSRKIPNYITVSAIILGLMISLHMEGITGLKNHALGMGLGFLFFVIPFIMGVIGGGDVKLMMAIGALMGSLFVFKAIMYTAIAGGMIAVFHLIYHQRLLIGLSNIKRYILLTLFSQSIVEIKVEEASAYFPYGIPIAIGTIFAYLI